ncbi:MAG: hypothetical protein WC682_04530 [Parcubacteria group bacterium]|jgi:hypothetical protein
MSIIEENTSEKRLDNDNFEQVGNEKEKVTQELEKIDMVRRIVEKRYPPYGVIKDFINHLASTEKVFILAGMEKFGGEEIMDMFIESETGVMVSETGIDGDVFAHIKEEFLKTKKTISEIKNVAVKLKDKYSNGGGNYKFIQYLEEDLIMLVDAFDKKDEKDFDVDAEREKAIHEVIVRIAEDDNAEIEELEKIYQEFKDELEKTTNS